MKTLTDILRDEFATESGFKTFVHTLDGCAGFTKGFVVTDVTDNDIGSIEGIQIHGLSQFLNQAIQICPGTG